MEVILLEKISGLGNIGDITNVKGGFARNYLIPRKKCLRATVKNKKDVEQRRTLLEQQHDEKKVRAEEASLILTNRMVNIFRQAGEDGRLYGSVAARDVAKALIAAHGIDIDDDMVSIANRIREIGIYHINVSLHADISFNVVVNIARNEHEAIASAEKYEKNLEQPTVVIDSKSESK